MIIITEDLRITCNSTSWMVEEKKVVKDAESKNYGQENWVCIGNYGNLKNCFGKILDLKRKEVASKKITIEKFLKKDAELKKWISDMFELFKDDKLEIIEDDIVVSLTDD